MDKAAASLSKSSCFMGYFFLSSLRIDSNAEVSMRSLDSSSVSRAAAARGGGHGDGEDGSCTYNW